MVLLRGSSSPSKLALVSVSEIRPPMKSDTIRELIRSCHVLVGNRINTPTQIITTIRAAITPTIELHTHRSTLGSAGLCVILGVFRGQTLWSEGVKRDIGAVNTFSFLSTHNVSE